MYASVQRIIPTICASLTESSYYNLTRLYMKRMIHSFHMGHAHHLY